jgi:carbonic anhydrase/acetyltransferase-like protein (isoleucine patch superfamily)
MRTPPPPTALQQRRENDNFELDHFKRDIDLTRFATQQYGYSVTAEGKNGQWQHLEKGGEKLLVSSGKGQEYPLYKNLHDERDAGTIIEFVQARGEGRNGPGLNLGEVRKELRTYLGEVGPEVAARPLPLQHPERQPAQALAVTGTEEERREALIRQVLGADRGLTDRTYLHSRNLTNETIDNPAFQNRVFTAQDNKHHNTAFPYYNETGIAQVSSKNQEPGAPKWDRFIEGMPKEGVWVSNPTEGRGSKVDRIVISESPIDSMSYHQLNQRAGGPNTMYVATGGTPTERQAELIQKIIDRQEPREIALANDRDPSGVRYNINYLNDLSPSRKMGQVAGVEAPEAASRPIEWHATTEGKYHNKIKVEFSTEKAHEGRTALAELGQRVEAINSGQNRTGEEANLKLEVIRTSSQESVARVVAPLGDTAHLLELAQYLHKQREMQLPAAERQPGEFIKFEAPITKDYNQDLALTVAGKSQAEIQAFADTQQRQYLEGKLLKQQQENEARRLQEQQRQQEAEAAAREREANSPEAQRRREAEERAIGGFIAGAVAAEVRASTTHEVPPGPVAAAPELPFRVLATVEVQEPAPRPLGPYPEPVYANQLKDALEAGGAQVTVLNHAPITYKGVQETELVVGFDRDQPNAASLSRTLDELSKGPGINVFESQEPASRATYYAPQVEAQPLTLPVREEPLALQRVIVEFDGDNVQAAQAARLALAASGAGVSPLKSEEGFADFVPAKHSFEVNYRLDQPELPAINNQLRGLAAESDVTVIQFDFVREKREAEAEKMSATQERLAEAGRSVELSKPGTSVEAQAELREVSQELRGLGMRVSPVETASGMTTVEAGYRIDQPELPRIHEALQAVGPERQVLLYQEPGIITERNQVLAQLNEKPAPQWSAEQTDLIKQTLGNQVQSLPYAERESPVIAPKEWNTLTVVVERGEPAERLRQALEEAGAKSELGLTGNTRAIHYMDGTSSPRTDYQVLHVAYPPAAEGGRPADVQKVLEAANEGGQTLLVDRFGSMRPESLNSPAYQEAWRLDLAVQPSAKAEYAPHPNGGGMVQNTATVDASVYVGPEARVSGTAVLQGNVRVEDYAIVGGAAQLSGNARVSENAVVLDGATVKDDAHISGQARISGHATVDGQAEVSGRARVSGEALISGEAVVTEQARIGDRAQVLEQARVVGNGEMGAETKVYGTQQVGEPNPPKPNFERLVTGLELDDVFAKRASDGTLLTADQQRSLQPTTLVDSEERRSLQQQVQGAEISTDARSWATGFHAGNVLPPDYAGNAEKYLVLRFPSEEAAAQVKTQLMASGGHEDIHVGAVLPVARPGQGMRADAAENDHEIRIAYHLNGRSLPAVHEAIAEAQQHPTLVRSFERPLDALDRADEVSRRPALELEAGRGLGAEAQRTGPANVPAFEAPSAVAREWVMGDPTSQQLGLPVRTAESAAAAEKLLIIQIAEPLRADGQHPGAERVRQEMQNASFATVGPVLALESPGNNALAVSEVRVAYHLGQSDLGSLTAQLDKLTAQPNVFVREFVDDRTQREQQLQNQASRELVPVSREMLEREQITQASGLIRVAPVEGQASPEAYAKDIRLSLEQRGATVQEVPSLTAPGSAKMLEYSYNLQQPGLNVLSRTLDEFAQQPGVKVQENERTQAARELHTALNPPSEAATRIPDRETGTPAPPTPVAYNARGEEKLAVVHIDEVAQPAGAQAKGKAEGVKENLEGAGAKVGTISSLVDEKGIRHSEMLVSYRTDEPNLAAINKQLNAVPGTGGSVVEHPADISQRQTAAANMERGAAVPERAAAVEAGR